MYDLKKQEKNLNDFQVCLNFLIPKFINFAFVRWGCSIRRLG